MKKLLFVALLAAAASLQAGPAFAQPTCSVATDSSEYTPGDTVVITGTGPPDSTAVVTVTGPTSTNLGTVSTESDGAFATSWDASGAVTGSAYTVQVAFTAGGPGCSSAFTFVVAAPPPPSDEPAEPGEAGGPDSPQELSESEKCKCPKGQRGGGAGGTEETPAPAGELPFTGIPAIWVGGLGLLLLASGLVFTRRSKS